MENEHVNETLEVNKCPRCKKAMGFTITGEPHTKDRVCWYECDCGYATLTMKAEDLLNFEKRFQTYCPRCGMYAEVTKFKTHFVTYCDKCEFKMVNKRGGEDSK